jgi:hypothetical protein
MISAAAFAVTADLLAVVADLPTATARHGELTKLMARADVAEAALGAKHKEFAQYQAGARAELARLESSVADQRRIVEGLESNFERTEFSLLHDESEWDGLGFPQDAPFRPTVHNPN